MRLDRHRLREFDQRLCVGASQTEGHFRLARQFPEVVQAGKDLNLIALLEHSGTLDLNKKLLAGNDVGRALSDQRLDRAASADDPPLGGGLRKRHGHDGLALFIRHHRRYPKACFRQFLPRLAGLPAERVPFPEKLGNGLVSQPHINFTQRKD